MFALVPEFRSEGLLVSLYQSTWKTNENWNVFCQIFVMKMDGNMPYFVYLTPPAKQHRRIWVKKSHESAKMCDTVEIEQSTAKHVHILTGNRWLAEGYPQTLSANVLRMFRKLSILTFWERYLLTLSGLSANVHVTLTLFCWVGRRRACKSG